MKIEFGRRHLIYLFSKPNLHCADENKWVKQSNILGTLDIMTLMISNIVRNKYTYHEIIMTAINLLLVGSWQVIIFVTFVPEGPDQLNAQLASYANISSK